MQPGSQGITGKANQFDELKCIKDDSHSRDIAYVFCFVSCAKSQM